VGLRIFSFYGLKNGEMAMSRRFLVTVPSLVLVVAVLGARMSGNDKSPFLVLAVLALMAIFCLAALVLALRGPAGSRATWLCLGTFLPLLYAVVVVVLARRHVIDSLNWLGFR
jgi:hypothetical protein